MMDRSKSTAKNDAPSVQVSEELRRRQQLRRAVGSAEPDVAAPGSDGIAKLRSLVGEGHVMPRPTPRSSADLAALVGPAQPASTARESAGLTELIGRAGGRAEGRADGREWKAPELALRVRRSFFGGRSSGALDAVSMIAAVVAVALLAGTVTFAAVQRATADPVDQAMSSLREREAELQNETEDLQTAVDLFSTSLSDAEQAVESAAGVLSGLEGRVDSMPLSAAESARARLASAVTSAPQVIVPVYRRTPVPEMSLEDVSGALDDVRLAREALPPLVAEVRDGRSAVTESLNGFHAELRNLGSAIEAGAARLVEEQDAASEGFRTGVTDAASRVVAAQRAGRDGLAEMPGYASAVDALRAENQRVLDARVEPPVRQRPVTPSNPSPSPVDPGTSTGGEPDAPDPAPSEPGTSPDPAPSDPGTSPPPGDEAVGTRGESGDLAP